MEKDKLKRILKKHAAWVRQEDGGKRADFSGQDLSGVDLLGADWSYASFCDTNLQGANLSKAYLDYADLSHANLEGANLIEAKMRHTNLREANLRGANLEKASLRSACMTYTDFLGANLAGALFDENLPDGFYQVVGCGSIGRITTYDSINDQVICGCWNDKNGNHTESFKKRVEEVYGDFGSDPDRACYASYMAAINFFDTIRKFREEAKNGSQGLKEDC